MIIGGALGASADIEPSRLLFLIVPVPGGSRTCFFSRPLWVLFDTSQTLYQPKGDTARMEKLYRSPLLPTRAIRGKPPAYSKEVLQGLPLDRQLRSRRSGLGLRSCGRNSPGRAAPGHA